MRMMRPVGFDDPPCGSSVTITARTPSSEPGTSTEAEPSRLVENSAEVGSGRGAAAVDPHLVDAALRRRRQALAHEPPAIAVDLERGARAVEVGIDARGDDAGVLVEGLAAEQRRAAPDHQEQQHERPCERGAQGEPAEAREATAARARLARSASGPAASSSDASRSTIAITRPLSAGGGSIGGAEAGSASTATRSDSASARQSAQVARCARKPSASSSGRAPSSHGPSESAQRS